MPRPPKMPFGMLPGLPSRNDQEVMALMEAIDRVAREGAMELARCLLRAALGHERTGDASYLTGLAEDTLLTLRLRSHKQSKDAFDGYPSARADSDITSDVPELPRAAQKAAVRHNPFSG
jgi:hypothetical protein